MINFSKNFSLDKRIEIYLQLNSYKARKRWKLFYFEGVTAFQYALKGNYPIKEVLILDEKSKIFEEDKFSFPITAVSLKTLSELSSVKINEGIITICEFKLTTVEKIIEKKDNLLILDGVKDPANMAAIMRSGEIFGCNHICSINNSVDFFNPRCVRASMGGMFKLNLLIENDFKNLFEDLKKNGYKIYSSIVNGGISIEDIKIDGPFAIVMGNESRGICNECLVLSDYLVTIPQVGTINSLNVSHAATIFMYKFQKNKFF